MGTRHLMVAATVVLSGGMARGAPKPKRPTPTVLLFMPATRDAPGPNPAERQFQPLLCLIDGQLVADVRCAELLPARIRIRIAPHVDVTVTRATTFAHPDDFPMEHYRPPYAAACCNYKGCQGRTFQYDPPRGAHAQALDDGPILGVWPPGADIGPVFGTRTEVEGSMRKAALIPDWLLATTDVDHDGHVEQVIYAPDANDYGISVVVPDRSATPIYAFSCGNG